MKILIVSAMVVTLGFFVLPTAGESPALKSGEESKLTSNQLLMRDKLKQMNRILEGLTLNKFDQVEDGAKTLSMISRAASWHISDPTPRYERLSKNFQEEASDLERHARDGNTDAATLDLVRLNVTCAECHQHMRDKSGPKQ